MSFPNGIGRVIGIVSARDCDGTTLNCSNLENILHGSFVNNNLDTCCVCADDGLLGGWICIRTPRRGTWQFPFNNMLVMENVVMKKIGSG